MGLDVKDEFDNSPLNRIIWTLEQWSWSEEEDNRVFWLCLDHTENVNSQNDEGITPLISLLYDIKMAKKLGELTENDERLKAAKALIIHKNIDLDLKNKKGISAKILLERYPLESKTEHFQELKSIVPDVSPHPFSSMNFPTLKQSYKKIYRKNK